MILSVLSVLVVITFFFSQHLSVVIFFYHLDTQSTKQH